jgi:hypothetical protein
MTTVDQHGAARPSTVPEAWRDARGEAARLACRLQYLTWPDRARVLDEFNRQSQRPLQVERVAAYAGYCSAVLTGMLATLGESGAVGNAAQALTFLLSQKDQHREAAVDWVAATAATAVLQAQLTGLPGFAFMLLTLYPNDSAESFMARDAFWTALLGRR